jgi:hypothetical protein
MSNMIDVWYDAVLKQMAAETYLEGAVLSNATVVKQRLMTGNNRPAAGRKPSGLTRFSSLQADDFLQRYEIKHQWSDDPTKPIEPNDPGYLSLNGQQIFANSGLSATLIRNID